MIYLLSFISQEIINKSLKYFVKHGSFILKSESIIKRPVQSFEIWSDGERFLTTIIIILMNF